MKAKMTMVIGYILTAGTLTASAPASADAMDVAEALGVFLGEMFFDARREREDEARRGMKESPEGEWYIPRKCADDDDFTLQCTGGE